jgi:hypothetical protein
MSKKEKAVGDRLRREIAGSYPEFSQGLHTRLCRAVQQYRAERAPLPVRRPATNWLLRWASFAAATCLVAVIGITWQVMHPVRDAGAGAPALTNDRRPSLANFTELAGHVTAKTDAMMDVAVKAQRWAYLDEDARSVSQMPAVRLPFDVITSLLSVQRKDHARGPSPRPVIRFGTDALREQAGLRHG